MANQFPSAAETGKPSPNYDLIELVSGHVIESLSFFVLSEGLILIASTAAARECVSRTNRAQTSQN